MLRESLVAQGLKNLPAMGETWVRSLGWEDPLEKEMATHSSILTWRIPWMEEPGGLQSTRFQRVGHDWVASLSLCWDRFFFLLLLLLAAWGQELLQLLSHVQLFETPWTAACQASQSITNSWSFLKLMSIELVMPSNHLISVVHFCPPSFPASGSFPMSWLLASLERRLQHQSFQWMFSVDFLKNWLVWSCL